MKNKFKKDWDNFNQEHYQKVKEARAKSELMIFKCTKQQKADFKEKVAEMNGVNGSDVLRMLMDEFTKSK
jgi:hypothetical protein